MDFLLSVFSCNFLAKTSKMNIVSALVLFIVLIKGLESGRITRRRISFNKPLVSLPKNNENLSLGCPQLSVVIGDGIISNCVDGKLYINGELVENAKPSDRIEVISNELRINGKFIRNIAAKSKTTANDPLIKKNGSFIKPIIKPKLSFETGCPNVNMLNCVNVFQVCKNGQLYLNDEKIDVNPTDKIEVISNNLKINGNVIRYIKPKESVNWF